MRKAVRTIVIRGDKMLAMKRNKFGSEYYTLVGGKIDLGETPEQAIVREVKEETQLDLINPRLVFIEHAGDPFGTQYIYLADIAADGEPQLDPGSVEKSIDAMGQNRYDPQWVQLSDLPKLPFRSETLKQSLLEAIGSGFPGEPKTIIPTEDIRYTSEVKKEVKS